jgi:hypothetical protein
MFNLSNGIMKSVTGMDSWPLVPWRIRHLPLGRHVRRGEEASFLYGQSGQSAKLRATSSNTEIKNAWKLTTISVIVYMLGNMNGSVFGFTLTYLEGHHNYALQQRRWDDIGLYNV